jgi:copper(I)-binding protein
MKFSRFFVLFIFFISPISMTYANNYSIDIEDAWIRAMPSKAMSTAAFMKITNKFPNEVKLISVDIDGVQSVELHKTMSDGKVMRMVKQSHIPLPANSSLVLKPGSWHIMMIGLEKQFPEGSVHQVQLNFDNGFKQNIKIKVKKHQIQMMHHM